MHFFLPDPATLSRLTRCQLLNVVTCGTQLPALGAAAGGGVAGSGLHRSGYEVALCPSCPLATMGDAGRTTRTAHRARDRRVRIDLDDPEAAAKQRKKARAKRLTDRFYARLGASRNIAGCAAAVARIEESDSEENRPLLRAGDERPEHRWCWFCGARGSHKRRSKQGKGGEKVA